MVPVTPARLAWAYHRLAVGSVDVQDPVPHDVLRPLTAITPKAVASFIPN